jgi:hypothetical protein
VETVFVFIEQEEDGCWEWWAEWPNGRRTGDDGYMSRELAEEAARESLTHDEAPK